MGACLVTGGIGFIGSHVCRGLLEHGDDVVVYTKFGKGGHDFLKRLRMPDIAGDVKFIEGDITDFGRVLRALKGNRVESIIHTAAIAFVPSAIENPGLAFRVNTMGTLNLLEAARMMNIGRVVHISTSLVYGDLRYDPADEDHPLEPKDIYGATKAASENIAMGYYRTYGLPVSIVRASSVYGPGDLENRVVKSFIDNALQGKPLELHGGGAQRRDFSYVKDVAKGILLALKSEKAGGEVFNIGSGRDYSIRELADIIKGFVPGARSREAGARMQDAGGGRLDISKARKVLGYTAEYDLRKGVRECIKWAVDCAPMLGLRIVNRPAL